MIYLLCLLLFSIGVYGLLVKKNIIKMIIGLAIIDYALNLFFVLIGYRWQGRSPIFDQDKAVNPLPQHMVDPLPQALVLTSIVIGLAVTALLVAIAIRLYDKYETFDITKIRNLRG